MVVVQVCRSDLKPSIEGRSMPLPPQPGVHGITALILTAMLCKLWQADTSQYLHCLYMIVVSCHSKGLIEDCLLADILKDGIPCLDFAYLARFLDESIRGRLLSACRMCRQIGVSFVEFPRRLWPRKRTGTGSCDLVIEQKKLLRAAEAW